MNWVVETASAAETQALGATLAHLLTGDEIIALAGDLGTGKTTFVQGLARGLGVTAPVTSPSFVLINRYRAHDGRVLQHADCYRLQNAALEMWDAGLGELLNGDEMVVVEWADRLPDLLPDEHLDIRFEYLDENRRRLTFSARGRRYVELLRSLAVLQG